MTGARCSIEGCTRETQKYNGWWICSVHWRKHVPPRSLRRRTYNRYFRTAKLHGWRYKGRDGKRERLDWRFERFWMHIIRAINLAEKEGAIDMAKINTMFGWDE